jgi:hypothetical protein
MRLFERPTRGTEDRRQTAFFALDRLHLLVDKPAVPCFQPPVPCFFTSSLVMRTLAFYNPSNTALKTVVSFIRHLGAQSPDKKGGQTLSECMNIDLHFGSFQEY